ncbi:MAG: PEP-CTERM sorting domain-containing protein [Pseudomonadota bacterium]
MKMTKWIAPLAVLGASLGGVANAGPATWDDFHDFTPDRLVTIWSPAVYTHDITGDGFIPGLDQVDSYSLTFNLYDDHDNSPEFALFSQPGDLLSETFFSVSGNEASNSWTLAGVWQLEASGRLTVAISSLLGDFYLGSSTLTVKGQHSVPEPGSLALFGAALLGFGLIRRKRITG